MQIALRFLLSLLLATPPSLYALGTYEAPDDFVREAFSGKPPAAKTLWLTDDMQPEIARILTHPYAQRRVRYWKGDERSVWILEEIGKEEPITTGIVVQRGKIELVRVLIYRESRGDEVRYPRFTDQFSGAGLKGKNDLDRHIDSISGASLSVRALTRLARFALYLDSKSREQK